MLDILLKGVRTFFIAYLVMVLVLYLFQRPLLYHPQVIAGGPADFGVGEMTINHVKTVDGLELKNWFAPPKMAGKPVAVLFYGNAAFMASRAQEARALLDKGYGVLLVSYRAYDGNPGTPAEQGLYNDGRANLDWLIAQGYPDFFLMGQSLGSGVAVQLATEYKIRLLVLEVPYSSMTSTAAYHYPFVPVRWLLKDSYDSLSKIARVHVPLFIVQGEADEVIPVSQGRALFAAANEPKEAAWLPGAHHNDYYGHGAWPPMLAFIEKYAVSPQ